MKPKEKDYASHVAYSRALEDYCVGLEKAAQMALEVLEHPVGVFAGSWSIKRYDAVDALKKELE